MTLTQPIKEMLLNLCSVSLCENSFLTLFCLETHSTLQHKEKKKTSANPADMLKTLKSR